MLWAGHRRPRPAPAATMPLFQAEDGIRDGTVTGVQTCALPIYKGTDIEYRHPFFGATPLLIATRNGHIDAVVALLQRGADVETEDYYGNNCLSLARELPDARTNPLLQIIYDAGARSLPTRKVKPAQDSIIE